MNESIFVHDVTRKKKTMAFKRDRPVVTVTGSHQRRTCVFGILTMEGKQFFR